MTATQPTLAANATAIRAFIGSGSRRRSPSRNRLADVESGKLWLSAQGGQNQRGRVEFLAAEGAAVGCLLIAAPEIHVPVFVDMRRRPGLVRRETAGGQGQCEQRGAGQPGCDVEPAKPPGANDVADVYRNHRSR